MENKKLNNLSLEELQELIIQVEEENQTLKEQILEKKEVIEDLLSIVE